MNIFQQRKSTYITILEGERPTTKSYSIIDDKLVKGKAENSYYFNYYHQPAENIEDFFKIIKVIENNQNVIIIRGRGEEENGKRIRRIKDNFSEIGTSWVCIDYDSLKLPEGMDVCAVEAIEYVIKQRMPKVFHDVSYVYQWSSSAGLSYKGQPIKEGFNCHFFFWLDKPLKYEDLKAWLDNSGCDSAAFRQVQPIFTTTKTIKDRRIEDRIEKRTDIAVKDIHIVQTPHRSTLHRKKEKIQKAVKLTQNKISGEYIVGYSVQKILDILENSGCIYSRHSNDTYNLEHSGEKSKGGWYIYTNDPQVVYHNGRDPMSIAAWLVEYWGVDITPEKESEPKKIFNPVSKGDITKIRGLLVDGYKQFRDSDNQAYVVITNPGVGKTISIPGVFEKVIYARSNNKAVRKLADDLGTLYPEKNIQCLYSFIEIFKQLYPKQEIVKIASDDIFRADDINWEETFNKMNGKDAGIAKEKYYEYIKNIGEIQFTADIFCMTTTMLKKKLWSKLRTRWAEPKMVKTVDQDGELIWKEDYSWEHPIVSLKQILGRLKTKKKEGIFGRWFRAVAQSSWDDDLLYHEVNVIPEDYLIVVDDITDMDTGFYKPFESGDDFKLERRERRIEKRNTKIDKQIRHLKERVVNDEFGKYFDEKEIEYLTGMKNEFPIDSGIYAGSVYFSKPTFCSVINKDYRTIFTAAELTQVAEITNMLDKNGVKYDSLDLRELQKAENCFIIPTRLTASDSDGILYPIINWVKRKAGIDAEYIADGYGCEFNHTNTKGLNDLRETNLVFKISRLHPEKKKALAISNSADIKNVKESVELLEFKKLAGDLEQVVGRGAGWRNTGMTLIGLVDPKVWTMIESELIYECVKEPFDELGMLVKEAVENPQKWFQDRSYSENSFLADCDIDVRKMGANDYKRIVRILRAVELLMDDSKKKERVINKLEDVLKDMYTVVKRMLKVSKNSSKNGEYRVNELGLSKPLPIIKSLGITFKRYQTEKDHLFYLNKEEREKLLAFKSELEALENRQLVRLKDRTPNNLVVG